MGDAVRGHWPEYLMEAASLGLFMVSACVFATLLEHPGSPVHEALPDPFLRRALIGVAMGLTAIVLIYSPWGRQSGAHLNPSVTLAFWRLGKVAPWDAAFYVLAQFAGGVIGVLLAGALLWPWVTVSNRMSVARFTGFCAGLLVAPYIAFEAPLSGMSMNPARTLGSAVPAETWTALWIYFTAPPLGMLLAAEVFLRTRGVRAVLCAKLDHMNDKRCIFRCGYAEAGVHHG
ncbi:MAG: aquaporin [Candidatus Rokubacteria bacterium]|nr:aquaporin [Candidatus Rokubacteria bacterium]